MGHEDEPIKQLKYLLSIPSFWTVADFRMDPLFGPFRDDPRFQAMLEAYGN